MLAPRALDREAARPARWPRPSRPAGCELIAGKPAILLDGAHNPEGVQALVRELDGVLGRAPPARRASSRCRTTSRVAAMLAALAPALDALVATSSGHARHARALPPQALADAARAAGFAEVDGRAEPSSRSARARERAGAGRRGPGHRIALPARARCAQPRWRPASMRRRRSLWRVFVLILGLILLTIAVFYAVGYALAKAIV